MKEPDISFGADTLAEELDRCAALVDRLAPYAGIVTPWRPMPTHERDEVHAFLRDLLDKHGLNWADPDHRKAVALGLNFALGGMLRAGDWIRGFAYNVRAADAVLDGIPPC